MLPGLTAGWQDVANALTGRVHPLIAAAVVSFGFVYLHPFMDGNGRLSRFLADTILSRSGQLPKGMVLPISAAMAANASGYLEALAAFSQPARARWRVTSAGGSPIGFEFLGTADMYRFWDATAQAKFLVRMAKASLEVLREGRDHIARFDRLDRALNEAFDLVQMDRHTLVRDYLEQGAITKDVRSRFANRIPQEAIDWLEENGRKIASGKA